MLPRFVPFAVPAAIGIPLYLHTDVMPSGLLARNMIGALVMVVPIIAVAASCESRGGAATPGKGPGVSRSGCGF